MTALTDIHRRPFITCLAVTPALHGSSYGVAMSASAVAPEDPAPVATRVVHGEPPGVRQPGGGER